MRAQECMRDKCMQKTHLDSANLNRKLSQVFF